jgi:hypothetical protein
MVYDTFVPVMSILALSLLLSSAALHALWNLLLKKSDEKYLAMGWQVIIGSIVSIIAIFFIGLPPRTMWLFILVSTILEAIYFALLTYAYNDHDFRGWVRSRFENVCTIRISVQPAFRKEDFP